MTDSNATSHACEYCDGSKKPIATEVDGEAHITLTPDDYEYPEGFLLDVYKKQDDGMDDGWEQLHGFNPKIHNAQTARADDDATADPDGDGLTNADECA